MNWTIDWPLFFSTYGLIFLAEWPDKTAFACVLLATRNHPMAVFFGAALAFVIQSLVAVMAGRMIAVLPERWVHLGSGILFLVFALFMWRESVAEESKDVPSGHFRFWRAVGTTFLVIFMAEWGDLTQLATATLEAKYHSAFTIFWASVLAMWTVTLAAVWAGRAFSDRLHPKILNRIAAAVFGLAGIYFIGDSLGFAFP